MTATFSRRRDRINNGWTDFHDLRPEHFSPTHTIGDGRIGLIDPVHSMWVGDANYPNSYLWTGHNVIGRAMGSLNGELTVEVDAPSGWHQFHQCSPAFGLALDLDCDVREVGVTYNWDAGLGNANSAYGQNVFSQDLDQTFVVFANEARGYRIVQDDATYNYGPPERYGSQRIVGVGERIGITNLIYRGTWNSGNNYAPGDVVSYGVYSYVCMASHSNQAPPDGWTSGGPAHNRYWRSQTSRSAWPGLGGPIPPGNPRPLPTTYTWTMRVVDGQFQTWLDGRKLHHPVPVPQWAANRDGWGLHVVNISFAPGADVFGLGIIPPGFDETCWRVNKISWQPYNTPLT